MIKYYILLLVSFSTIVIGCNEADQIGYLEVENAEYAPDSLVIRKIPDPFMDYFRIENNAPWVTPIIQGVVGTQPIFYSLEDVKSSDGNALELKNAITMRGAGEMYIPLENSVPIGTYFISIRIKNEGFDIVKEDMFKIIVEEGYTEP